MLNFREMNINTKEEPMQTDDIYLTLQKRSSTHGLVKDNNDNEQDLAIESLAQFGDTTPKGSEVFMETTTPKAGLFRLSDDGFSKKFQRNRKVFTEKKGPLALATNDHETEKNTTFGAKRESVIEAIERSIKLGKGRKTARPKLPKKQLIISFCLLVVGLIGLLVGTIYAINSGNPSDGIAFWVIGGICGLPGLYYAVKFCKLFYATSAENRRKALDEIPQD